MKLQDLVSLLDTHVQLFLLLFHYVQNAINSFTMTLNLVALKYTDVQGHKPTSIYRTFHSSSTFTFEPQASEYKHENQVVTPPTFTPPLNEIVHDTS